MILPDGPIRVWLATRPVDFRNYVERAVMPSWRGRSAHCRARRL